MMVCEQPIRWILGRKAQHRTAQYLKNYTEQSHRAVKQRCYLSVVLRRKALFIGALVGSY